MKNFCPPCADFSKYLNACMTELFSCIPESFYPPSALLPPHSPAACTRFYSYPQSIILNPFLDRIHNTTLLSLKINLKNKVKLLNSCIMQKFKSC